MVSPLYPEIRAGAYRPPGMAGFRRAVAVLQAAGERDAASVLAALAADADLGADLTDDQWWDDQSSGDDEDVLGLLPCDRPRPGPAVDVGRNPTDFLDAVADAFGPEVAARTAALIPPRRPGPGGRRGGPVGPGFRGGVRRVRPAGPRRLIAAKTPGVAPVAGYAKLQGLIPADLT